jgi:hypothetical protein
MKAQKYQRPDARNWWRNLQRDNYRKATAALADPDSPPYLIDWAKKTLQRLAVKPRPQTHPL